MATLKANAVVWHILLFIFLFGGGWMIPKQPGLMVAVDPSAKNREVAAPLRKLRTLSPKKASLFFFSLSLSLSAPSPSSWGAEA